MDITNLPHITKEEIEARQIHKRELAIKQDIAKIDDALEASNPDEMLELHRHLDGKYQSCIVGWGQSMWCYNAGIGFAYRLLGNDAIKENLSMMKAKLEAFKHGWNSTSQHDMPTSPPAPGVNVSIENNVLVNITFEQVREKIEDMTALSREQTDEILERINELEEIAKENSSRKTKWEKVKPIIAFALDKGADVAVSILSLVVQMKLGL